MKVALRACRRLGTPYEPNCVQVLHQLDEPSWAYHLDGVTTGKQMAVYVAGRSGRRCRRGEEPWSQWRS